MRAVALFTTVLVIGAGAAGVGSANAQAIQVRARDAQSIIAAQALPKPRPGPFNYSLAIDASAARYSGPCPTTVRFRALIDSSSKGVQNNDGTLAPGFGGQVQFHFERSDGSKGPTQQLSFTSDRPLAAYDEWPISQSYAGWEKVVVDRPLRPTTGEHVSAPASFQVVCR